MAGDSLAADISSKDFSEFCDFVVQKQKQGAEDLTPEQSVEEFRKHQSQLQQWQEKNALSQQQAIRGEAKPINEQALMARVRERLAEERRS